MKGNLKKLTAVILSSAMLLSFSPASPTGDTAADVVTGYAATGNASATGNAQQGTSETAAAASTEAPVPANGWNSQHTSYYKNSKAVTGRVKIGGKYYFFNGSGVLETGVHKVKKKLYYFSPKDGAQVVKSGLYNNRYYMKKGVLQTGFIAKGNKAWYFRKSDGAMQKGGKVKYLKIPKSGNLGSAYANGIRVLNRNGWSLKKAYSYSYHLTYANRWMRKKNSQAYANVGFRTGTGNCFVMAATFYIQAKLLGYDIHQVQGHVGTAPHSWTIIKQNGKTWVYDPNFRNETGRRGWKIYYGRPGTWRYSGMHRMN